MRHLVRGSKVRLFTIAGAVLLALTVSGFLIFNSIKQPSAYEKAAASATFPVFSIPNLPEGYKIDERLLSLTSQAFLVAAKNAQGKTIVITQVPMPKDFDYEDFYDKGFSGLQDAPSIYGRGKVGMLNGKLTGSLVTDSTWILIKSHEEIPADEMKQIIKGMKPLR